MEEEPEEGGDGESKFFRQRMIFDGKRMRKPVVRKTIDFNANIINYLKNRVYQRDSRDREVLHPTADHIRYFEPLARLEDNPSNAFCTKYVSVSINKIRCAINCVVWTPEGRRLITGAHSGEFTLWNGLTFNFETILQAHDDAVRSMVWSHNDMWMVTADEGGVIKYWQASMNNVKAFKGHKEAIRDLSFCPTDMKFASCSDDQSISVWDFERCQEDNLLKGHGWDVKSVQWHPYKALILSGSKDNLVKLWDPRAATCLATLQGHKNTVTRVRWNDNGNWFLSCSRDQLVKVWDIRKMKDFQTCRGHKREVTAAAWHPTMERLFCTGSFDGSIHYWLTGDPESQAEICGAHESSVWDLAWHPLGHILVSGSNDHTTRFWTRNRPGDEMKDKYNANQLPEEERQDALLALAEAARNNPNRYGKLPVVLEGFQAPNEGGEEDEAESTEAHIPGMGSASSAMAKLKQEEEKQVEMRSQNMQNRRPQQQNMRPGPGTSQPSYGVRGQFQQPARPPMRGQKRPNDWEADRSRRDFDE